MSLWRPPALQLPAKAIEISLAIGGRDCYTADITARSLAVIGD